MTFADAIILVCSALGLLISIYFALVYYHVMKPDSAFLPSFCRMDERTCESLLRTRNARILGPPNFLIGIPYYVAVSLFVLGLIHVPRGLVLFASLSTVVLGVYLVRGLVVTLKTHCVLCYTSHACNLVIFAALIVRRLE